MKVTLVGAGNLGHTIFKLLTRRGFDTRLVTSKPEIWKSVTALRDVNMTTLVNIPTSAVTSDYSATRDADMIIVSSPVNAYESILSKLQPKKNATICTTFQCPYIDQLTKHMWPQANGLHLQYVPFQAKIIVPGKSSHIVGWKDYLEYIGNDDAAQRLSLMLGATNEPIRKHPLAFVLTTSNPILHMPCYYTLFHPWDGSYPTQVGKKHKIPGSLYKNMNEESADLIQALNDEVMLIQRLIEEGSQEIIGVEPLIQRVQYQYGDQVGDYTSLHSMFNTATMYEKSSISYIKYPDGQLLPDVTSRHFTDDVPFGLMPIKELALKYGILQTPVLDTLIFWAQRVMKTRYLLNSQTVSPNYKLFNSIKQNNL